MLLAVACFVNKTEKHKRSSARRHPSARVLYWAAVCFVFMAGNADCDDAAPSFCFESSHAGDLSRNSCIMCLRVVTYSQPRSEAETWGRGLVFREGWGSETCLSWVEPLCCSASCVGCRTMPTRSESRLPARRGRSHPHALQITEMIRRRKESWSQQGSHGIS